MFSDMANCEGLIFLIVLSDIFMVQTCHYTLLFLQCPLHLIPNPGQTGAMFLY